MRKGAIWSILELNFGQDFEADIWIWFKILNLTFSLDFGAEV